MGTQTLDPRNKKSRIGAMSIFKDKMLMALIAFFLFYLVLWAVEAIGARSVTVTGLVYSMDDQYYLETEMSDTYALEHRDLSPYLDATVQATGSLSQNEEGFPLLRVLQISMLQEYPFPEIEELPADSTVESDHADSAFPGEYRPDMPDEPVGSFDQPAE